MTKNKNNYKDSGVNIEEGQKFIADIKNLTSNITPKYSLNRIGGFSGYIEIPKNISTVTAEFVKEPPVLSIADKLIDINYFIPSGPTIRSFK